MLLISRDLSIIRLDMAGHCDLNTSWEKPKHNTQPKEHSCQSCLMILHTYTHTHTHTLVWVVCMCASLLIF